MGNSDIAQEIQKRIFKETGRIVEDQMRQDFTPVSKTFSKKDFIKNFERVVLTDRQKLVDCKTS